MPISSLHIETQKHEQIAAAPPAREAWMEGPALAPWSTVDKPYPAVAHIWSIGPHVTVIGQVVGHAIIFENKGFVVASDMLDGPDWRCLGVRLPNGREMRSGETWEALAPLGATIRVTLGSVVGVVRSESERALGAFRVLHPGSGDATVLLFSECTEKAECWRRVDGQPVAEADAQDGRPLSPAECIAREAAQLLASATHMPVFSSDIEVRCDRARGQVIVLVDMAPRDASDDVLAALQFALAETKTADIFISVERHPIRYLRALAESLAAILDSSLWYTREFDALLADDAAARPLYAEERARAIRAGLERVNASGTWVPADLCDARSGLELIHSFEDGRQVGDGVPEPVSAFLVLYVQIRSGRRDAAVPVASTTSSRARAARAALEVEQDLAAAYGQKRAPDPTAYRRHLEQMYAVLSIPCPWVANYRK